MFIDIFCFSYIHGYFMNLKIINDLLLFLAVLAQHFLTFYSKKIVSIAHLKKAYCS